MKARWEPPRTRRLADPAEVQGITERLVEFFDWVAPEYDQWAGGLHTRPVLGSRSSLLLP